MRKVATYLHRVGKSIVARVVDPRWIPRIGAPLFDGRGKKVGVVADVIGNVKSPYIVVRGSEAEEYFTEKRFLLRGDIDG